jgi:putative FmdB family regulatory protein
VPTYQYACTNPEGKHEFERVQSFSDAPVTECPQCGSPVRKVYGSVGVVFKGSGFYRTDSRKAATSSKNSSSSTNDSSSSNDSSPSNGSSSSKESSSSSASTSTGGSKAAS